MCIGIFKNKWKDFEPTKQYLLVVSELTSVSKLYTISNDSNMYQIKQIIGKQITLTIQPNKSQTAA